MVNLQTPEILEVVRCVLLARLIDETEAEEAEDSGDENADVGESEETAALRDRILSQLQRECAKRGASDAYEAVVAEFDEEEDADGEEEEE